MQCPNDGAVLTMSERSGIEIDYCPTCRGVWLDRGELDKIIERSLTQPAAAAAPAPAPAPQQQYQQPASSRAPAGRTGSGRTRSARRAGSASSSTDLAVGHCDHGDSRSRAPSPSAASWCCGSGGPRTGRPRWSCGSTASSSWTTSRSARSERWPARRSHSSTTPAPWWSAGWGSGSRCTRCSPTPASSCCSVVEIEQALVDWMRDGTVPHGPALLADERVNVVVADIAVALAEARPASYDLVLLDVDNGPGYLVHAGTRRCTSLPRSPRRALSCGRAAPWSCGRPTRPPAGGGHARGVRRRRVPPARGAAAGAGRALLALRSVASRRTPTVVVGHRRVVVGPDETSGGKCRHLAATSRSVTHPGRRSPRRCRHHRRRCVVTPPSSTGRRCQ